MPLAIAQILRPVLPIAVAVGVALGGCARHASDRSMVAGYLGSIKDPAVASASAGPRPKPAQPSRARKAAAPPAARLATNPAPVPAELVLDQEPEVAAEPLPPRMSKTDIALRRGTRLLDVGRVLAAREELIKHLGSESPAILVTFARTFDPQYIGRLARSDARPDAEAAVAIYVDAERLGSTEASEALARLRAGKP